ncbi:MAG: hypothetical protein GWO40_14180 [Gammaproteobacteria bacterium]|nr:hypothetical protein [Gammaproteobacteria bacterium]NIV74987.1 hypothetical protein [Gammaproteobacteria bacterium]NIX86682.1 hypothetical protein [Gammaproteobacteria bacterium]
MNGPLLLDDIPNLSPLLGGRGLDAGGWRALLWTESGPLGRPVAMATFLLNALTSGNDTAVWKWTNSMLHLLTGLVVFWLSAHTWCIRNAKPGPRCWYAALVIGAVWLLHPLQVSTVLYTVQRMTQLSALFVFSGLLAYVLARKQQLEGRSGYPLLAVCFLVFLPLATLSKENGALLVPLAFLVEMCLFRFEGTTQARRTLAVGFGLFLVVPLLYGGFLIIRHYEAILVDGYLVRPFTLQERVLTEFRVLFLYIQQLILPIQQTMGFVHDDIAISRGWLAPPTTLLSLAGLSALLVAAWLVRDRAPLVTLGILFFFTGHSLESTLLPLEIAFEHRNYAPSYGVFVAMVAAVAAFAPSPGMRIGGSAVACAILAALTLFRVQTWASEVTLLSYTYQTHPDSERVNAVFAERLTGAGRYQQALALLESRDGAGAALQRLYIRCLMDQRIAAPDIDAVSASLQPFVDHYVASGLMEVGRLGITGVCRLPHARYAELVERALKLPVIDPTTRQKLLMYQAHYLWYLEEADAALETLRRAHATQPGNVVPLLLATEYLLHLRRTQEAQAEFERALQAAAGLPVPYSGLVRRVEEKLARCTRGGGCPASTSGAVVLEPQTDNVVE